MIPRFRAWNKATKEMHEVDDIVSIDFEKSEICVKTLFFGKFSYYDLDDIVFMQSTGLTDENGKEIFEGDILKITDEHSWLEVVSFSENKGMFVSKKIHRNTDIPESPLWDLFITNLFRIKIIGNIYEKPELLEVSS